MNDFKKGDILVNTRKQFHPCGATRLSEHAIVKAYGSPDPHTQAIAIYRDKEGEKKHNFYYVDAGHLRLASIEEQVKYEQGVRYA
jgi:hypothetical protein